MRGFISIDLEGLPFIVSKEQLEVGGTLFDEARSIATELTLCVCEALKQNGVDSVLVADSHESMVNIIPQEMPDYVELLRGYPRATSMVSGAEDCDFGIFLGYHAKGGTEKATFDHAFSGSMIDWIKVNGIEASEYFINGLALGRYNVPVILVAGDEALMKEVSPDIERLALKSAVSRYAAKSKSLRLIKKELTYACARALERFRMGAIKPMKTKEPIRIEMRFTRTESADYAELLPSAKRIDGKTIEFESRDILEGYRTMELLIFAIYGGRQ
ncbi:MAG: M55 family metallopeptidase [Candidatus Thermoplasmatota archaeon]|nr:M55 family metallopeptidase [Candidatus Thermoplasmatota archaeon]